MSSRPAMCDMCAANGRMPRPSVIRPSSRMQLPASHTPRCRHAGARTRPTPPIINMAGKVPSPNDAMVRNPGSALAGARRFGRKGINQRTRQEAVEHPKGERRSAAAGRQQAAQGHRKRAAAEADRKAMKRLQQAEELQRHRDHEQSRDNRENSLGGVQRAVQQRERGSLPAYISPGPARPRARPESSRSSIVRSYRAGGAGRSRRARADRGRARRQSRRTCRCNESCRQSPRRTATK